MVSISFWKVIFKQLCKEIAGKNFYHQAEQGLTAISLTVLEVQALMCFTSAVLLGEACPHRPLQEELSCCVWLSCSNPEKESTSKDIDTHGGYTPVGSEQFCRWTFWTMMPKMIVGCPSSHINLDLKCYIFKRFL